MCTRLSAPGFLVTMAFLPDVTSYNCGSEMLPLMGWASVPTTCNAGLKRAVKASWQLYRSPAWLRLSPARHAIGAQAISVREHKLDDDLSNISSCENLLEAYFMQARALCDCSVRCANQCFDASWHCACSSQCLHIASSVER